MSVREVSVENGKYTLQFNEQTGEFKALRYGEEWQNLAGDKLTLSLLHKIEELQDKEDEMYRLLDDAHTIMGDSHCDDNEVYSEISDFIYDYNKKTV